MINNYKGLIKMNLQLLAEDDGAGGGEGATSTEENKAGTDESKEEVLTFTKAELEKLMQSEKDKAVTQGIKTAKSNWEKEYVQKLADEKANIERRAKLSTEERMKEEYEEKIARAEQREREAERDRLELKTVKELGKQGLDESFSSFLLGENEEKTLENISDFKSIFDKAVETAVNERLKGKSPTASQGKSTLTKESIMNIKDKDERLKTITENMHLFE